MVSGVCGRDGSFSHVMSCQGCGSDMEGVRGNTRPETHSPSLSTILPPPTSLIFFFFEIVSHWLAWLVSNSQRSSCLCLPKAGIKGTSQHLLPAYCNSFSTRNSYLYLWLIQWLLSVSRGSCFLPGHYRSNKKKVSDHKHYSGNSQITSLPTLSHSYETSGGLSFLDWREAPALSKELEGFWSLG